MPRIVLPITSRGIELTDRACWAILGVAMAIAAGLILYLGRGTSFNSDELHWFYATPALGVSDVLEPHNGNLIVPTRLIFKGMLESLGAGYVPFRVLGVLTVLLCAGLFYALVKRRLGAPPALAPAVLLLFFGSADGVVVAPIGFSIVASIAAGLGSLLALERDDRRGDVAACALVTLSVITWGTGLAFVVGAAISVLLRGDRWRRAWIFLVPLAVYVAWWVWALDSPASSEGQTMPSNALLIPYYVAASLSAVTAALAGLNYDFTPSSTEIGWGAILAALAVIGLGLRIRRGSVPRSLWVSLGIVLSYWALSAFAVTETRTPGAPRYLYTGAVGVLLVAAEAARPIRFTKLGLLALLAALGVSLSTNLALLRDHAAFYRGNSSAAGALFAMLELARDRVDPDFGPGVMFRAAGPNPLVTEGAGAYFTAADRYGSLALPLTELERQGESVRQGADQVLASALELRLEGAPPGARKPGCEDVRSEPLGGGTAFELPPGGATVRAPQGGPAEVTVGRFGTPSVEVGTLSPGGTARLTIPPDTSPRPWRAFVARATHVEVCPLR